MIRRPIVIRRPALIPTLHKIWIALASAMLLAGCAVEPTPASYTYQQTPCPPGVGPGAPPPQAQNAQPPAEAPPMSGQAPDAPQPPSAPPPQAQAQPQGATPTCYTAVPNSYTYNYYPGYPYPAYGYPYYPYPYYGYGPYYGPSVGIGFGYWHGGDWHHWH